MRKVMIYQHGGSFNHGCEALATTVSKIIKETLEDVSVVLCSGQPEQDEMYDIKTVDAIVPNRSSIRRWTFKYFIYQINKRVFKNRELNRFLNTHWQCIKQANDAEACVAIGGDMYCYNKGQIFWNTDSILKSKNKKMMLWGCSIEPDELPGELATHLKNFDIITARESITFDALIKNGLGEKTHLVSDPAFLLEKEECSLPENWKEGKMVGINLSPLVLNYTENKHQIVESVYSLIEYIIENTDMNVALIPHVRLRGTDDISVMEPIYKTFEKTNRVVLFDDVSLGCKQIKGYIARCRFFVGARTHSVIAAYSSCVPAIALGYSVKANGIAKDIFGTSEKLVIPVQTLTSAASVIENFNFLVANEEKLKEHLEAVMPKYKEKAKISGKLLKELIE